MATIRVRYLVQVAAAPGHMSRWFWKPGPTVRSRGWCTQRVPPNWGALTDEEALVGAAIAHAEALNAAVSTPEQKEDLSKRGFVAMGGAPKQLDDWLKVQEPIWVPVLQAAGIKPE